MARHPVHNTVDERTTGYIKRKKLDEFLMERYKVDSLEKFEVQVRPLLINKRSRGLC
jgi:hypothetical protein